MKAFASLTLEEKQRTLSKILSVLRTTIFVGKNKVAYNLQAIIHLAKCKIMVDAKFNKGCVKVNRKSFILFILETPYWRIRDLNVQGFSEGETEYDYEPYGPKRIPTGVHFDGTPFEEYEINEIMGCLYELRAYLIFF